MGYWGVKGLAGALMPAEEEEQGAYALLSGTLDPILGDLSRNVLDYERRLREANVCWRVKKGRGSTLPDFCPPNYNWDASSACHAAPEALYSGGRCSGREGRGLIAVPARCDEWSSF